MCRHQGKINQKYIIVASQSLEAGMTSSDVRFVVDSVNFTTSGVSHGYEFSHTFNFH